MTPEINGGVAVIVQPALPSDCPLSETDEVSPKSTSPFGEVGTDTLVQPAGMSIWNVPPAVVAEARDSS